MKVFLSCLMLSLSAFLSACASNQVNRTPSSQAILKSLGPGAVLNCERGTVKANVAWVTLKKEESGDFTLKYRRMITSPKPWIASAACREQDNGVTCLAKDGIVFRLDYAFSVPSQYSQALVYQKVKFDTTDDLVCMLGGGEDPWIYHDGARESY